MKFKEFNAQKYYPNLDGMRGISILLVIFHHITFFDADSSFKMFQNNANKGVWLFFICSGFLISNLLLKEYNSFGKISLKNFLIRRGLRLYPLYYLVLAFYFAVFNIDGIFMRPGLEQRSALFNDSLLSYIFYYSNLIKQSASNLPPFYFSWSLATEEQFYFIYVLIFFFMIPKNSLRVIFALLFLKYLFFYLPLPYSDFTRSMLIPLDVGILMGVSLGHLLSNEGSFNFFNHFLRKKILLWVAFSVSLALMNQIKMIIPQTWQFTGLLLSFTYIFAYFLLGPTNKILENRGLRYLGKISYGVYMLNLLAIRVVQSILNKLGVQSMLMEFIFGTMLVFLLAHLSYKYFELPFIRLKKKFSAI
jgi:peptidoglycan/LPS O-acetylase OafA/YrhL